MYALDLIGEKPEFRMIRYSGAEKNKRGALVVSHIETGGQSRHSGESRNPEKSTTWTPAFAGVTVQLIHAFHRD
ncbi:MAG: hypothetical protein M1547_00260 [Gammaproteobacteria bacterium]|nr:hypothetical protein [Gammaproteobacteria bacterium]